MQVRGWVGEFGGAVDKRLAGWQCCRAPDPLLPLPHALPPPCSEPPQPSIRDVFGLGSLLDRTGYGGSGTSGGASGGGSGVGPSSGGGVRGLMEQLAAGSGEAAAYAATRATMEAALDEAEQRALWARYRVH